MAGESAILPSYGWSQMPVDPAMLLKVTGFRSAMFWLFMLPLACGSERHERAPTPATSTGRMLARDSEKVVGSLISLIGRPDRFRGSELAVSGYLVIDRTRFPGHDGFLFLRKEDAALGFLNGVFVDVRACAGAQGKVEQPAAGKLESYARYSQKYAYVYGTFAAPNEGGHSLELGAICGLTNVVIRQMAPSVPTR